jgi:hypothetical protein
MGRANLKPWAGGVHSNLSCWRCVCGMGGPSRVLSGVGFTYEWRSWRLMFSTRVLLCTCSGPVRPRPIIWPPGHLHGPCWLHCGRDSTLITLHWRGTFPPSVLRTWHQSRPNSADFRFNSCFRLSLITITRSQATSFTYSTCLSLFLPRSPHWQYAISCHSFSSLTKIVLRRPLSYSTPLFVRPA